MALTIFEKYPAVVMIIASFSKSFNKSFNKFALITSFSLDKSNYS